MLLFMGIIIGSEKDRHDSLPCKRWCFLTHWSYDLLFLHILASITWKRENRGLSILFEVATSAALSVSVGYYSTVVWTKTHGSDFSYWISDFGVHFFNSLFALHEILVNDRTWDKRRFWAPVLYSASYTAYNFVIWKTTGVVMYQTIRFDTFERTMTSAAFMAFGMLVSAGSFVLLSFLRRLRSKALSQEETQRVVDVVPIPQEQPRA